MMSTSNDSSLSTNQDTNQFFGVSRDWILDLSYSTIKNFTSWTNWNPPIQMRLMVNVHTLNNGIKHGNLVLIHKTIATHPFPCHLHYNMHCKMSKHHSHASSFLSSPIVFESINEQFFFFTWAWLVY